MLGHRSGPSLVIVIESVSFGVIGLIQLQPLATVLIQVDQCALCTLNLFIYLIIHDRVCVSCPDCLINNVQEKWCARHVGGGHASQPIEPLHVLII